jgi:hypothetical protein
MENIDDRGVIAHINIINPHGTQPGDNMLI